MSLCRDDGTMSETMRHAAVICHTQLYYLCTTIIFFVTKFYINLGWTDHHPKSEACTFHWTSQSRLCPRSRPLKGHTSHISDLTPTAWRWRASHTHTHVSWMNQRDSCKVLRAASRSVTVVFLSVRPSVRIEKKRKEKNKVIVSKTWPGVSSGRNEK